jgi:hypothetical protein
MNNGIPYTYDMIRYMHGSTLSYSNNVSVPKNATASYTPRVVPLPVNLIWLT